jgi:hypothetical protein
MSHKRLEVSWATQDVFEKSLWWRPRINFPLIRRYFTVFFTEKVEYKDVNKGKIASDWKIRSRGYSYYRFGPMAWSLTVPAIKATHINFAPPPIRGSNRKQSCAKFPFKRTLLFFLDSSLGVIIRIAIIIHSFISFRKTWGLVWIELVMYIWSSA